MDGTLPWAYIWLLTFFAGGVDAIGGGGGLISVPAFLTAGVPNTLLLGTNKSMAAVGTCVSVLRYSRAGLLPSFPPATWARMVCLAIFSGGVGAALSQLGLILNHLGILIPCLLLGVMAFLVHRWWGHRHQDRVQSRPWSGIPVALIAGYDGLFGPGTGTFFLSYFERIGMSTLSANATTKIFNLSSNVGALTVFALRGRVDWKLGLSAAVAYMLGNYVGSGLVLRRGQTLVRVTVLLMTTLMLVKYAWSYSLR